MGWAGLDNIDDVDPLGDDDRRVMDEVKAILEKHGALERFGLTLLHSHFDLAPDEILVETVDVSKRTLKVQPVPAGEVRPSDLVATSWRLDGPGYQPLCGTYCHRSGDFHAC